MDETIFLFTEKKKETVDCYFDTVTSHDHSIISDNFFLFLETKDQDDMSEPFKDSVYTEGGCAPRTIRVSNRSPEPRTLCNTGSYGSPMVEGNRRFKPVKTSSCGGLFKEYLSEGTV